MSVIVRVCYILDTYRVLLQTCRDSDNDMHMMMMGRMKCATDVVKCPSTCSRLFYLFTIKNNIKN